MTKKRDLNPLGGMPATGRRAARTGNAVPTAKSFTVLPSPFLVKAVRTSHADGCG